ncbi:MAG: hypothetical protein AAFY59_02700 [Pseudomonadota bacterium]
MDVRVIIGHGNAAFADAVFAMCERTAEPLGLSLSLAHVPGAGEFEAALGDVAARAYLLTPEPARALQPKISALVGFSVEVQPNNITAEGRPSGGADAQLYGLGMPGYGTALELIAERLE